MNLNDEPFGMIKKRDIEAFEIDKKKLFNRNFIICFIGKVIIIL